MVDAGDKRELPESANAMICCDGKLLAIESIVAMLDEEAVIQPLLMDLVYMLQGMVFHHQAVNRGESYKELLTKSIGEVVQAQSLSDVFILIRTKGFTLEDANFMLDAGLSELDGVFYAVCDSVEYGDEMIVDLIYKVK